MAWLPYMLLVVAVLTFGEPALKPGSTVGRTGSCRTPFGPSR